MTTRVLKVYNGSTLIETFTLGTDIGHYLVERSDVRNELRTVETVDTRYYKELYRPTYKFTFNNVTLADIINMFAHEISFYSFYLTVDGFEYQVVPMASTLKPYHPASIYSQWVVEFADVHQYDVPRLDLTAEYDMMLQENNAIGILLDGSISYYALVNTESTMINLYADIDYEMELTHSNLTGTLSEKLTLKEKSIVSVKPYSGVNLFTIKAINGNTNITQLLIWSI